MLFQLEQEVQGAVAPESKVVEQDQDEAVAMSVGTASLFTDGAVAVHHGTSLRHLGSTATQDHHTPITPNSTPTVPHPSPSELSEADASFDPTRSGSSQPGPPRTATTVAKAPVVTTVHSPTELWEVLAGYDTQHAVLLLLFRIGCRSCEYLHPVFDTASHALAGAPDVHLVQMESLDTAGIELPIHGFPAVVVWTRGPKAADTASVHVGAWVQVAVSGRMNACECTNDCCGAV